MMEAAGSWEEEEEEEEVFDNPQGAGPGSSTLTPLLAGLRSKPIRIAKNGAQGGACSSPPSPPSSSIPNPFPELEKSPPLAGSLPPPPATNKHLVKVYGEDSHSRSVWVSRGATAREVCLLLVTAAHCSDQENWALLELHPTLGLERCLEDHEVLLEVQSTWSLKGDTRFAFCKNYAKYEFFRSPTLFFPENMISDSADETKGMTSSDLIQELLKSGTCPEIQGFLQVKEPSRKSWKKVYFFLRRSGLYCSTKGCSKEPRHLQYVADLDDLSVYTVVNSRKLYSSPADFTFCIKGSRNPLRVQDLKLLCGDSEQTRTCWTSAFRLFKYGKQLQSNYQVSSAAPKNPEGAQRAEARAESSMVAMDFTGKDGGRVIENPTEAESAEREEGRAWRVRRWRRREALRCSTSTTGPQLSMIHRTQQWFHGGVSRKDTQRLIEKQGLVDGLFLVRDSQQHVSCFVLSLCFKLKTKHYLVIPCDDDDKKYVTMDDGVTLFIDLLQLVEFHQINRGILPVCLRHPCVCVAMVGTAPADAPADPAP